MNRDRKLQDHKKGLERIKKEPELKEKFENTIMKITYIMFIFGINILVIGIILTLIQIITLDIMELLIIISIGICGGGLYIYYTGHKRISKM